MSDVGVARALEENPGDPRGPHRPDQLRDDEPWPDLTPEEQTAGALQTRMDTLARAPGAGSRALFRGTSIEGGAFS